MQYTLHKKVQLTAALSSWVYCLKCNQMSLLPFFPSSLIWILVVGWKRTMFREIQASWQQNKRISEDFYFFKYTQCYWHCLNVKAFMSSMNDYCVLSATECRQSRHLCIQKCHRLLHLQYILWVYGSAEHILTERHLSGLLINLSVHYLVSSWLWAKGRQL